MLVRFAVEFELDRAADAALGILLVVGIVAEAHRIDQGLIVAGARLLGRWQVLRQGLCRVEITTSHLLWDLCRLLVDPEVVRCHVHVPHRHQRTAHVYANGRRLVRVVIIVVVAHVANVCRGARGSLQILHTMYVFARVRCLLLLLPLVRQVRFVTACSRQFALGRVPVFVHVDTGVHLLRLLRSDRSALGRGATARSRYLVPLTLPGALYSVALRIGSSYLRNLIVALPWSAISERVAHAQLLLEVLLGLLRNQLPSLGGTGAADGRATAVIILSVGNCSLFHVARLVRQRV